MAEKYKVLLIEDKVTDSYQIALELKKRDIHFNLLVIDTLQEFIDALPAFSPDIILCDYSLPYFNSFDAIKILKAKKLRIPFILITDAVSEEVATLVVKEGADDYILKDRLKTLPNAVINALEKSRFEKESKHLTNKHYKKKVLSNERFSRLSDNLLLAIRVAGIGIWEYCLHQNKLIADDVLFSLYGITAADFDGSYEMWMHFIHPEDKERVNEVFQNALTKDSDFDAEFRIVRHDGSVHFIKAVALVQRDSLGNPSRLIGTSQDITSGKEAEQVVKESEAKYRSLFHNSMDGILLTNADGTILAANPAACEILKMTEVEICSAGRFGIIDVSDLRLTPLLEERRHTGRAKGEINFLRKDGSRIPVEVTSAIFKDANGIERTCTIIRDITERKQAEQKFISTSNALQQALNDLKKIMDSSLDIICTIDEEGRFVNVSSASEYMWGYNPDELPGKRYMDLVFNEDIENTINVAAGIMRGTPVTMFENRYVRKDGSKVPMLWSARWDDNDKLMYCIAKDATEKKRLEKAFESERQRFYDMFLQAPASLGILKGPEHVYEMANPLYVQLIGKKDIIGKTVKEVLPKVAEQGLLKLLNNVYTTGESFTGREMLIKLDKEGSGNLADVYVNLFLQAYKNKQADVEGIFFFAIDVTEQVQARKKIGESEKRFRQIVETAQEGIWMIDENNKTVLVNQKMCELLEYNQQEMIGRTTLSFKDEEGERSSLQRPEMKKQGINETYESKFITKSGRHIWSHISTNPIFEDDGTYKGVLAMVTDITARKLAEEKLRENQEQLLESQRIAHIGSWQFNFSNSTDIYASPIYCSEETYRIFGHPPNEGEISYRLFSQFVHPQDRNLVKAALLKSIANKSSHSIDYRIIHTDGRPRWVHQEAKVITDLVTGKPIKMFGNIKDITIRKEQELKIIKNTEERELLIRELIKSNMDLKQFSYITSHNFRAPLSNLVGLLNLVDYNSLDESNKEIIEMFKTTTQQLNKTINDLIQILIIRHNVNVNIANNNIKELFDDACSSLIHQINEIGCTINKNFRVENIAFNKSYLESILVNLLSNAIKYRSPDRLLEINISTELNTNKEVVLKIQDNGLGIDLERHGDRIFGLYQRFHTNADSIGLGLFIVKSQITALGGNIEVQSEVDKGTTFCITFK